jgi:GAF domain-containing protein
VQAGDLTVQMGADAVALSLATAADQMAVWLQSAASATASPMLEPAIPENEQERLNALRELGLTSARGEHFDALAKKVAEAFDMPIALVSLIDETNQLWPGAAGLPPDLDASRQAARSTSICGHVVADGEMVVVEDVTKDERFTSNPFLLEKGIRFYAGAPLRTSSGFVLGSLCVIDVKPRSFGPKDRKLLQLIADELMSKVEAEHRYAPVEEGACPPGDLGEPPVLDAAGGT